MVAEIDKKYFLTRPTKVVSRMIGYALFEGRDSPVFILGTGRSGTTVLGTVLSMHKSVGYLNEPKALWHSVIKHEDLIGSYTREPAKYRLTEEDATPLVVANANKIYGGYLSSIFSSRVVDKYPEMIFRIGFLKKIFPDAKFVFLVRNGFDTCASIENWSQRLGKNLPSEEHDWWGVNKRKWKYLVTQIVPEHEDLVASCEEMLTWSDHRDMAMVEWIVTMREGFVLEQKYANDTMRVDFESLASEPQNTLSALSEFLRLKADPKFMTFGCERLKPVNSRGTKPINPILEKPFLETMKLLGYSITDA